MGYPHFTTECAEHHDLVRDFAGDYGHPPITVLCGSTRFYGEFQQAIYDLTMKGHIVLAPGVWVHGSPQFAALGQEMADRAKVKLDELHKHKIDLADGVYVVSDATGYFGDSTRNEIAYAESLGKPVLYLVHQSGDPTRPLQAAEPTVASESAWFPTCTSPDGCGNGPDIVTPDGPLCVKHAAEASA